MTKEHILDEIKRIAVGNNGVPPGAQRFRTETGISESAWSGKYWARWGNALREAGFSPNVWQVGHGKSVFMESYIRLIRELAHFPAVREISLKRRQDSSFPSSSAFVRFGSKAAAAKRIIEFCQKNTGYEDVIKICEPVAAESSPRTHNTSATHVVEGFVYLIKSGRHYKLAEAIQQDVANVNSQSNFRRKQPKYTKSERMTRQESRRIGTTDSQRSTAAGNGSIWMRPT